MKAGHVAEGQVMTLLMDVTIGNQLAAGCLRHRRPCQSSTPTCQDYSFLLANNTDRNIYLLGHNLLLKLCGAQAKYITNLT